MRTKVVATVLFFTALLANAQQTSGGIIYGDDWAYLIKPPAGWVWDSETLQQNGIWGLFYKEGITFDPSKLHMYIAPNSIKDGSSLANFIKADIESFKKSYGDIEFKYDREKKLKSSLAVQIYHLNDTNKKYFQQIGYLMFRKTAFIFVLSARSIRERNENKPAFDSLLDSFSPMEKTK
jgi:hypothetical protein